ncbi:MAG TPA: tetratricopeptide repeat protein [Emticicia sp.]
MRRKLCLLLVFVFAIFNSIAQDLNMALRYIKVGNTLREAKQFTEAERYLSRGREAVEKLNNRYWMAVAYENLGLLSRDKKDVNNALIYLRKSSDIYQSIGSQTSYTVIKQILSGLKNETSDLYGGVEIGSKGVKLSIIAVKYGADGKLQFVVEKADDTITDAVKGTEVAFNATAKAVKMYLDTLLTRRKLPKDHIFVVASSGVSNGLRKLQQDQGLNEKSWDIKKNDLKTKIENEIRSLWSQPVEFLNAKTESELTVRGTLPSTEWSTTATLDIGSGNTKGGFYVLDDFKYVDFLGTVTYSQMVEKNQNGKSYADACKAVMEDGVKEYHISSQLGQYPEFYNREKIYLMGGVVFAVTTYLHPEQILNKEVSLTYNEVKQFRERLIDDYAKATTPSLTHMDDKKAVEKANKEITRLREKTFKQNELIAGTTLLLGIMEDLRKEDEAKKFVFNREGYVGWISGYIVKAIEKDLKQKKES